MTKPEVVSQLVSEAKANPASNAVFHVFGLRQRTRPSVSLVSLYHKMRKEGFSYTKEEYLPVLRLLATSGFGDLDVTSHGRVKGLKNIKTTLQSIGQMACGQKVTAEKFKPRRKFVNIMQKPAALKHFEVKNNPSYFDINLEVNLNGKVLHIPVPKELDANDLQSLLSRLRSA